MKEQRSKINIPPEGIETPLGYLYNPPGLVKQIISLVLSFSLQYFLAGLSAAFPEICRILQEGLSFFHTYLFSF